MFHATAAGLYAVLPMQTSKSCESIWGSSWRVTSALFVMRWIRPHDDFNISDSSRQGPLKPLIYIDRVTVYGFFTARLIGKTVIWIDTCDKRRVKI